VALPIPDGWPQHALLRTDISGGVLPLDALGAAMAMFEDPRTKELLVTPRGVRIVHQAAQGERAHYMVLRQAVFDEARLAPALAARLLEQAAGVRAALAGDGGTALAPFGRGRGRR
jgi:hypothetical protein